ncbi:molybdopterin-dependent oxidoreductase alpha subunit [Novosphingobium sp. PhB165]|uniref:FdhF/YdeP family oxidoreductase n=1 Tax=Novosphingobium sp. PhB165 TaxID=2485105 RepID=UPI001047F87E|nr:FdhF/YdeP family oxidoreductase [Novosphingobium sp. PhB165]TCM13985.1 molybdopterin-dependent oxidoreductase alpha subunit [Novosphingobium sp. PhB165]
MDDLAKPRRYDHATGGWGSLSGIAHVEAASKAMPSAVQTLAEQNKPGGYMCSSCAWAKPPNPHVAEFCENGAKATIWDLTSERCTPEFFARHTVSELSSWDDHELERAGRLTEPLRYDASSDRYVPVGWDEAFAAIGENLRHLDPKSVTFYASGKAALEPSYLYALFARMYGHNNLPDSSNMCHETTSVGLKKVIGSPVGTCTFEDLAHCDAIFYLGQNPGTNSPRILHPLKDAVERGCKIIAFNPLRERGLIEFADPQNPWQMTVGKSTRIAHQYLQVRPGGDIAALMGVCKRVLQLDQERGDILDASFLAAHCHGLEEFRASVLATSWSKIEQHAGVTRAELEQAGDVYAEAERVIGIYGMGLTQQVHGSQAIGMLVNLLLLRGNIGRKGAGCQPIRGHSNVQGQRTVGISEKPELVPMDKLREIFGFEPPLEKGHTTVEFLEALLGGRARGFVALGGNLARAVPDQSRIHPAWRKLELTAHVATRLNRTHLLPGKEAYLLPCLARAEEDLQETGAQTVTIEDSFSHIYASMGRRQPASPHLKSELAIVAGIAKATLSAHPLWRWDEWTRDYAKVRSLIERTYPDQFREMNARMNEAGGFYRGNPAHDRIWKTESGKAEFTVPTVLNANGLEDRPGRYTLLTLRSNDQFNTTIYGHSDRLRGLKGSRMIVLMNPEDMRSAGLGDGQRITLVTDCDENFRREVTQLSVTPYDLPRGCLAGYFPELNPLVPLNHHDVLSKTPAAKGIPVRIEAE